MSSRLLLVVLADGDFMSEQRSTAFETDTNLSLL
jgi:hypothetical protein